MALLPEITVFLFSLLFLVFSLLKNRPSLYLWARGLVLLGIFLAALGTAVKGNFFAGAYRVDLFSQVFKFLIMVGFALVIFMFESEEEVEGEFLAEYFMFLGFSTLGLMMLVSSVELISIAISLEISSFSLYAIVPLRRAQTRGQLEASVKYLFFGAMATGVMLYGIGYIYGITHSTFLVNIIPHLIRYISQPLAVFAVFLILAAFFFKLSLFPFHFWAPDVYEGAANSTAAFIATLPKVAAAALVIRISMLASAGAKEVAIVLSIFAALSMFFGNLVGLVQKDIKRLLAYSGIAHAGYLLMGILPLSEEGAAAAIYYMAVYLFMNLACFYVLLLVAKRGENVAIDGLSGLAKKSPLLAFTLATAAFSLAGIPPTGGFTGKLFLFVSAFKGGYLGVVIIGAINTAIALFYYLNLVRMSYAREENATTITLSSHQKLLCYIFSVLIIYLGVMPFGLLNLFKRAF